MGFISYTSSIFQSTTFLAANIGLKYASRAARELQFVPQRGYASVIAYAAKRTMMQLTFAKINDLYPAYVRQMHSKRVEESYSKNQGAHIQEVISDNDDADNANVFKSQVVEEQQVQVRYMGKPVPEALLLWIPNKSKTVNNIYINTYWDKIKNLSYAPPTTSNKTLENTGIKVPADKDKVFWDLGPMVQVQSGNNVVLTKVQGRDFSRKELISGGDINFTVTGKIVSNYPDVYPYDLVSRFITLMQHKGVLCVSNLMMSRFNVTQVIIKDFQMGQNEGFKNVQPYSFTCVAVEPDEAVEVIEDTIHAVNLDIGEMKKNGWSTKLLENVKAAAANQAAQMVSQLTSNTI